MKTIRTMLITGLLLSALPAFATETTTASLPKDGAKACEGRSCGGRAFDSKLKMTDEQRTKLGALSDKFKLENADKIAELKVSYRQLHELMSKPTIDKSAVLALEGKINALKADLSTSKLNMKLAAADIFTPEQRAQFAKLRAMREHGFHGGRHGMHGKGGREGGREWGGKAGGDKA